MRISGLLEVEDARDEYWLELGLPSEEERVIPRFFGDFGSWTLLLFVFNIIAFGDFNSWTILFFVFNMGDVKSFASDGVVSTRDFFETLVISDNDRKRDRLFRFAGSSEDAIDG